MPKKGVFCPKVFKDFVLTGLADVVHQSPDPKGLKYAIKSTLWVAAMDSKILDLQSNDTWVLVP